MKNQLIHIIITTVVCVFGAQAFGQTPDNTVKIIQKTQVEHSSTIVPKNKLVANVDNPSSYAAYVQKNKTQPVVKSISLQTRLEISREKPALKIVKTQNSGTIKHASSNTDKIRITPSKIRMNSQPKLVLPNQ